MNLWAGCQSTAGSRLTKPRPMAGFKSASD